MIVATLKKPTLQQVKFYKAKYFQLWISLHMGQLFQKKMESMY